MKCRKLLLDYIKHIMILLNVFFFADSYKRNANKNGTEYNGDSEWQNISRFLFGGLSVMMSYFLGGRRMSKAVCHLIQQEEVMKHIFD